METTAGNVGGAFGRRTFLRLATFSAGMAALSRLPAAAAAAPTATAGSLRVLSPRDAGILTAIGDRIADTGDPAMPRFADTPAVTTVDTALLYLSPDVVEQLHWALLLIEYGPPVFALRIGRFSTLEPAAQDEYLRGWAESRFDTRRLVFRAVKNLSFLGYYSQDATWAGIHYGGPWAPRPRRPVPT